MDFNLLLDVAKNKTYTVRKGNKRVLNFRKNKYDEISGEKSKTFEMMSNLIDSRFYDIMRKTNTKLAGIDVNKAVTTINSTSAFLALSFNYASGVANVINGNAQLFMESVFKGMFIKASSIKKANGLYAKDLPNTLKDVTSPINMSYTNQVAELFNTWGHFNLSNANFLKSDLVKKGLSTEALQVFQESGEHWLQSVTTMSVLDGIKVMNNKGKFIDKNGKVVSESNAASLLDMLKKDEGGRVYLDPAVVYTTHSKLSKWKEGGKEKVQALIIKKLYDVVGNYRKIDQPDLMRTPWGQLIMLYRKYFFTMGIRRFRGIETVGKPYEDLSEDDLRYSYALQDYEEGVYTTLIRYIITSLKGKKKYLLRSNWNELSDMQKHQIKFALTEFSLTLVMVPVALAVMEALNAGDDEKAYFLMYQLRRLDTELSQFYAPGEAFKMIKSPIPSLRLIEQMGTIFAQTFAPWTWDDVYERGPKKGQSKYKVKVMKQIPVLKEFQRTFEDLYDYQKNTFGVGF
jgi:hypothetical protein